MSKAYIYVTSTILILFIKFAYVNESFPQNAEEISGTGYKSLDRYFGTEVTIAEVIVRG